ncbi:hypothetical protein DES52_10843 [Deinococcus yavapaiensis KR-236]|uniref:Uncharacterized protein n=2 Tax=Deinococcus TaxID=1298 RepID=A0A318S4W4_9DEIO|nr:hypothetical protein DES52_10843 [Deinococcus yavapaiensis KR-236]
MLAASMAAAQPYVQHDFGQIASAAYRPLFAWCDGPDRVVAVSSPAKLLGPNETVAVSLASLTKSAPERVNIARYQLGPADGAAGSVYYGLRPFGSAASTEGNFLHVSNIQRADGGYTFTHVVAVTSNGQALECRYFTVNEADPASGGPTEGSVFAGASAKRSVWIQRLPNGRYMYRSFDYVGSERLPETSESRVSGDFDTSKRGIRLSNGIRTKTSAGGLVYQFRNGGYTYRVEVGSTARPFARVTVTSNGRTLLSEPFRFYSDSRPRGE